MSEHHPHRVSRRDFLTNTITGVAIAAAGESFAFSNVSRQGVSWLLENKLITALVQPKLGRITVHDKISGYVWNQPAVEGEKPSVPIFRNVKAAPSPENGITFETDFGSNDGIPNTLQVTLTIPDDAADLAVSAVFPDLTAPEKQFRFLPPFLLDTRTSVLAVADYCDGHLYPLRMNPFPRTWFDADRLDMPWVGVCDLEKGMGYILILETDDDAAVQCRPFSVGGNPLYAPQVLWSPCKGTFGYPRRILYRFFPKGGYVAAAKSYRSYAKEHGLLVSLAEKSKRNPNVQRLFGAVDVWGDSSLTFAREAKSLGVEKMLIHGRSSPEEMQAINELGYLTSEYDNYTDILPIEHGNKPDSGHDLIPEHVVLMADGKRMTAWLTYDKKTQYMKRCPTFWRPTAEIVIPDVLSKSPFLGRFIDVTTAEGLYECYDPNHPLTRTDKRHCGEDLLGYVSSLNLVLGGEHGIWWGAPHQCYIEGMMSGGGAYPWPAGWLIHPKTKNEKFPGSWESWSDYERWGIGHEWRVPLWELVFHDCVVPTWYWGDSNDWLLQAAPGITSKKNAFNVLYGTMPMLWADKQGSWQTDRDIFLRSCRNVCHMHAAVAEMEMVSHQFLTADHAVQSTLFSDGTVAVVNFGGKPYQARLRGKSYLLPQNGFCVNGPHIEQSRHLAHGKIISSIHQDDYHFTETEG